MEGVSGWATSLGCRAQHGIPKHTLHFYLHLWWSGEMFFSEKNIWKLPFSSFCRLTYIHSNHCLLGNSKAFFPHTTRGFCYLISYSRKQRHTETQSEPDYSRPAIEWVVLLFIQIYSRVGEVDGESTLQFKLIYIIFEQNHFPVSLILNFLADKQGKLPPQTCLSAKHAAHAQYNICPTHKSSSLSSLTNDILFYSHSNNHSSPPYRYLQGVHMEFNWMAQKTVFS